MQFIIEINGDEFKGEKPSNAIQEAAQFCYEYDIDPIGKVDRAFQTLDGENPINEFDKKQRAILESNIEDALIELKKTAEEEKNHQQSLNDDYYSNLI